MAILDQSLQFGAFSVSGDARLNDAKALDALVEQVTHTSRWWDQTDSTEMNGKNFMTYSEHAAPNRKFLRHVLDWQEALSQLQVFRNAPSSIKGLKSGSAVSFAGTKTRYADFCDPSVDIKSMVRYLASPSG